MTSLPSRPKVGVITQARMTSTRLPGKVLLEAGGRTMLDHHLDRLAAAGLDVYVATTVNATDDPIVALADSRGLPAHRGPEEDVLERFVGCADAYDLDVVVRVTSDCPLIDGAIIADAVDDYLAADDSDLYVSNALERTFPRGMDFEIFGAALLREAAARADRPEQREHVTPYFYTNVNGRMHLRNVALPADHSAYRITLDTEDDLRLIRTLIEDHDAATLDCAQIVAVLQAHPELTEINAHIEQKKLGS